MSRDLTVTRTGLRIGVAHQQRRQLHTFTTSEEQLQRALLAKPRRVDWPSIGMAVFIGLALAALLLHEMGALL